METQYCSRCQETKSVDAFQFRRDRGRNYYRKTCKACQDIRASSLVARYTPEQEKHILQLYSEGYGVPAIVAMTGYSKKSKMSRFILQRGVSRTGKELHARISGKLLGKRFGKLVLLERTAEKGRSIWKCQCDCGNIADVVQYQLTNGVTKSCGCLRKRSGAECKFWLGCGELSGYLFGRYRANAAARNMEFNITVQDAWAVFQKQDRKCALSGISLVFGRLTNETDGTASLDRIDSNRGYTLDNIQWVHKWLNIFKRELTDQELFIIIKAIYEYHKLQNLQSVSIETCLSKLRLA